MDRCQIAVHVHVNTIEHHLQRGRIPVVPVRGSGQAHAAFG